MHPVLFYESFFFCTRDVLEGTQLVRKSLRNMIVAGSNALPLRPIYRVDMDVDNFDSEDKIRIFLKEDEDAYWPEPDYEASVYDGDFAETFRRLQHTCVKFFCVEIRGSPFLRYWQAQADAAFTVVRIDFDHLGTTEYGFLDSVVNHLRPKITSVTVRDANRYNSEKLKLLARNAFLNHLHTCRLVIWDDAFPQPAFVLKEPGYRNYELRCKNCQVADGIDGFIECFVRDGCANSKLESVYVFWDDGGPQSTAPKTLRNPTKIDKPLPKVDLTTWLTGKAHRVSPCETQSFMNTEQRKRMDVYKWSVDYDLWGGQRTTHILQCRVVNL